MSMSRSTRLGEEDGVFKCRGHMLQYHSGDPVGSRRFVVWSAAEGFLKYRRGDLADQH